MNIQLKTEAGQATSILEILRHPIKLSQFHSTEKRSSLHTDITFLTLINALYPLEEEFDNGVIQTLVSGERTAHRPK